MQPCEEESFILINYFTLRLKFKNPPHQTLDIALVRLYSAQLELEQVIFSTTFFVRRKGSMYLTLLQMECPIAPD